MCPQFSQQKADSQVRWAVLNVTEASIDLCKCLPILEGQYASLLSSMLSCALPGCRFCGGIKTRTSD